MFGCVFNRYIKTSFWLGTLPSKLLKLVKSSPAPKVEKTVDSEAPDYVAEGFHKVDAEALRYGDNFRGMGVLIGLVGIIVVFLAISPTAFAIENEDKLIFIGVSKVVLMGVLLTLVYVSRESNWKSLWMSKRDEAEELRYRKLKLHIDRLKGKQEKHPEDLALLRSDLLRLVSHPVSGQVAYNKKCAAKYEAIEHLATFLAWGAFFISFLAAIYLMLADFHLAPECHLMILFTAGIPAAVGGIHGINGFLQIGALIDEHRKTEQKLVHEIAVIERSDDPESLLRAAVNVHAILSKRDEWKDRIEKTQAVPG
jgi:hypothetical protein